MIVGVGEASGAGVLLGVFVGILGVVGADVIVGAEVIIDEAVGVLVDVLRLVAVGVTV